MMSRKVAGWCASVPMFLLSVTATAFQADPAVGENEQEAVGPKTDPAAMKSFEELVHSYRSRPALGVKTTLKIGGENAGTTAAGKEIKAEYTFGPNRSAVITLRGYTCYLSPKPPEPGEDPQGILSAVHEKNEHAYFTMSDEGSPYYALLNAFVDLPFPELAIELGEDGMDDVLMQFHPRAPAVVPVAVSDDDRNGAKVRHIKLASETDTIDIYSDPTTSLIQGIDVQIGGGTAVQPGTKLTYSYTYEYQTHDQPLDAATFTLDPKDRQRVDLMTALAPKPIAPEGQPGIGGEEAPAALVGKPAPEFTLATADGKAVDLEKLRGRVVVLDFWATWCGPCRAALPLLHQVAKWASDEQLPVTVITINVWEIQDPEKNSPDARLAAAKAFWEKQNFTLPIAMDYSDETGKAYGVRGIPTGIIIRADGIVHAQHVGGGADYVESMKRDIKEAIAAVEAKK